MLKTVKIGMSEYRAIKALAKKDGRYLQHHLTEAIRTYLASQSNGKVAS
jgi:hypothetical protein